MSCYGNAGPDDYHLLAAIVAIDGGIDQREREKQTQDADMPLEKRAQAPFSSLRELISVPNAENNA